MTLKLIDASSYSRVLTDAEIQLTIGRHRDIVAETKFTCHQNCVPSNSNTFS